MRFPIMQSLESPVISGGVDLIVVLVNNSTFDGSQQSTAGRLTHRHRGKRSSWKREPFLPRIELRGGGPSIVLRA